MEANHLAAHTDYDAQRSRISKLGEIRMSLSMDPGKADDRFLREKKYELLSIEHDLVSSYLSDVQNVIANTPLKEDSKELRQLSGNLHATEYGLRRYLNFYAQENADIALGRTFSEKVKNPFSPVIASSNKPVVNFLEHYHKNDSLSLSLAKSFSTSLDEVKSEIRVRKMLLQRLNNYKSTSSKEKAKPNSDKIKTDMDALKEKYNKQLARYETRLYQMYLLRTLDILAMDPTDEERSVLTEFYTKCLRRYRTEFFTNNWSEPKHKAVRLTPYDQDRRICPREFELRFHLAKQGYRHTIDMDHKEILKKVEWLFEIDGEGKTPIDRNPHAAGLLAEELGLIVAATGDQQYQKNFWFYFGSKRKNMGEKGQGSRAEQIMLSSSIRPNADESVDESITILHLANLFRHLLAASHRDEEAKLTLEELNLGQITSSFIVAKGKENGASQQLEKEKSLGLFREMVSATRDYEKERSIFRLLGEIVGRDQFKTQANKYLIKLINDKAFHEDDLQRKSATQVASAFLNHFIGTFKRDEALFYKFVRLAMLASITLGVGILSAATIVIAVSSVTAAGFIPIAAATGGALLSVLTLAGAGFGIWHTGNAVLNLWVDRKRSSNERLIRTLQERTLPRMIEEVGTYGYFNFGLAPVKDLTPEEKKEVGDLVEEWKEELHRQMETIEGMRQSIVFEHLYEYRKFISSKIEEADNKRLAKAAAWEIDHDKKWLANYLESIRDLLLEPFQDWNEAPPSLEAIKTKMKKVGFVGGGDQNLVEQIIYLIANAKD